MTVGVVPRREIPSGVCRLSALKTMSTTELNDVQKELEAYLVEQVADGQQYFKSKYIADDLDLTSKSVGTNLGMLQGKTDRVDIKNWSGGSSGITWLVSPVEDSDTDPAHAQDARTSRPLAAISDD